MENAPPITLALSIPPEFERMTFDKEFYGRRFAAFENRVVTSIPWTPGERELRYTYILRNTQEATTWQRPMDLPCSDVTVRIEGRSPDEARCALLSRSEADANAVVYTSAGQPVPAGRVLRVELGRMPLPWMTYGKWAALAVLLASIVATSCLHFARRRAAATRAIASTPARERKKRRAA